MDFQFPSENVITRVALESTKSIQRHVQFNCKNCGLVYDISEQYNTLYTGNDT